jgi:hypothetical protein
MAVWDLDGSGKIDQAEFLQLLQALREDATAKYKDLTTFHIMCCKDDSPGIKYTPPHTG